MSAFRPTDPKEGGVLTARRVPLNYGGTTIHGCGSPGILAISTTLQPMPRACHCFGQLASNGPTAAQQAQT
jgi:hypothetical protein